MKKKAITILAALIFVAGLGVMLYPTISDLWNSFRSTRRIQDYTAAVSGISEEEYNRLYLAAERFNQRIPERANPYVLPEEDVAEYNSLLNIGGNGIMGYIEVPSIKVALPICHGTAEDVLQTAIGHMEQSSLPVGGASTHCVLSGHRGLPSAKLFTDLDRVAVGDRFMLYILNEVLTYEVDQILTVLPDESQALQIIPGEDYCTLVTCTPYGINTHRLLVRGHRVETIAEPETERPVTTEPSTVSFLSQLPPAAIPLAVGLTAVGLTAGLLAGGRQKKRGKNNKDHTE